MLIILGKLNLQQFFRVGKYFNNYLHSVIRSLNFSRQWCAIYSNLKYTECNYV